MERYLEPEWLDELPVEDPGAIGSRRDLERLNAWMGNARTVARALRGLLRGRKTPRIAELGAGDGQFMCRVAERLGQGFPGATILLLDRQSASSPSVAAVVSGLGWSLQQERADVFEWLSQPSDELWDAFITNLFLHHFSAAQLVELLGAAAQRTQAFVAVEPRRSGCALAFSSLVRMIGCNHVTQHDAPVSVRAGFRGRELTRLWPATEGWRLQEKGVGLFSHLFVAERRHP